MARAFPQVRAAAIDERAHNVFYRQTQLERLCKELIAKAAEIREAISKDYGHSDVETALELSLTLQAVKKDYASLQPDKAHEEEYLLAAGKDAPHRRRPVGIVYIEPCMHTLFYSTIVPLSAAIAAGNCAIVLLEPNLRAVPDLLRHLLLSALDQDAYGIASSAVRDDIFPDSSVIIYQEEPKVSHPRCQEISSPTRGRTIAIVDRTANIQMAAREVVAARSAFGGRSPYAPDLVLVNEFVKPAFLQAVLAESAKLADGSARKTQSKKVEDGISRVKNADPDLRVVSQQPQLAVVELMKRDEGNLSRKIEHPILAVHAMRSLDDAIDLANTTSSGPCLAAYHFGNAGTGKYLAQFVDSTISFVNHIPREILVGPAFPANDPIDLSMRYPVELFTMGRPAFAKPSASSTVLNATLALPDKVATAKLLADATAPLAVMKRSEGGGVGFFEQGFLFSAALILTTTISVTGAGVYLLMRRGRPFW